MTKKHISIEEYITLFDRVSSSLLHPIMTDLPSTDATACALLITLMAIARNHPAAVRLICFCAYIGENTIPKDLLQMYFATQYAMPAWQNGGKINPDTGHTSVQHDIIKQWNTQAAWEMHASQLAQFNTALQCLESYGLLYAYDAGSGEPIRESLHTAITRSMRGAQEHRYTAFYKMRRIVQDILRHYQQPMTHQLYSLQHTSIPANDQPHVLQAITALPTFTVEYLDDVAVAVRWEHQAKRASYPDQCRVPDLMTLYSFYERADVCTELRYVLLSVMANVFRLSGLKYERDTLAIQSASIAEQLYHDPSTISHMEVARAYDCIMGPQDAQDYALHALRNYSKAHTIALHVFEQHIMRPSAISLANKGEIVDVLISIFKDLASCASWRVDGHSAVTYSRQAMRMMRVFKGMVNSHYSVFRVAAESYQAHSDYVGMYHYACVALQLYRQRVDAQLSTIMGLMNLMMEALMAAGHYNEAISLGQDIAILDPSNQLGGNHLLLIIMAKVFTGRLPAAQMMPVDKLTKAHTMSISRHPAVTGAGAVELLRFVRLYYRIRLFDHAASLAREALQAINQMEGEYKELLQQRYYTIVMLYQYHCYVGMGSSQKAVQCVEKLAKSFANIRAALVGAAAR